MFEAVHVQLVHLQQCSHCMATCQLPASYYSRIRADLLQALFSTSAISTELDA